MSFYDVNQVEQYIRQAARQRGMDPDIAVRVARAEGLGEGIWRSNFRNKSGKREPSYGPFQLLVGGGDTGYGKGVGNEMIQRTGIDPRDPANVFASIDFALDTAAKDGWRKWYGASKVGVSRWDGIRGDGRDNARAIGVSSNHPTNNVAPAQYASLSSDPPTPPPRPGTQAPLPPVRNNQPEFQPYWEYLPMDSGSDIPLPPPRPASIGFQPPMPPARPPGNAIGIGIPTPPIRDNDLRPNPSTMQTRANPTGVAHGFSAVALNHGSGEIDANAEQASYASLPPVHNNSSSEHRPGVTYVGTHGSANLAPSLVGFVEDMARVTSNDLTVTSGYRDPALNRRVGGVPNSSHLTGNAIDLRTRGQSPDQLRLVLERAARHGYLEHGVSALRDVGHYRPGKNHAHFHVEEGFRYHPEAPPMPPVRPQLPPNQNNPASTPQVEAILRKHLG